MQLNMTDISVIIVKGLPGAGKSTLVNQYDPSTSVVCSADNYWIRPDGIYDWNPKYLKNAHDWCKEEFKNAISWCKLGGSDIYYKVIVDNTNTTWREVEFYADYALQRGVTDIRVVEPQTSWRYDVEECFKRNTHNVPKESIQKMFDRWEHSDIIEEKIEELKRVKYPDLVKTK